MNENEKPASSLPPLLGEPEREDIHQIHQALLKRERLEPRDGFEPAPKWVWAVSVVIIFAMGYYLGRYSGSFSADPDELYQPTDAVKAEAVAAPSGELVYGAICAACHQPGGAGVEARFPPLAGSEWVHKDPNIPVRIVLNGLGGPIQVKGRAYQNEMPPLRDQLTDEEIAAALSYARSAFGNKAPPVDVALVKKLRAETAESGQWTVERLEVGK